MIVIPGCVTSFGSQENTADETPDEILLEFIDQESDSELLLNINEPFSELETRLNPSIVTGVSVLKYPIVPG
jgi:hypothetical protein